MNQEKSFAQEVREKVKQIPRGKVVSYGQLACMLGKPGAARAVASIMINTHQEDVPCHRVVHQDGSLCPSAEFGTLQRLLLESEGVLLVSDKVNMAACRWQEE